MESLIEANSAVSAAHFAGSGRFPIEPAGGGAYAAHKQRREGRAAECNLAIYKPMLRAGKGTVQRKMTLDLYTAELDVLYEADDETNVAADGTNVTANKNATIQDEVKGIIAGSTDIDANRLDPNTELFALGLDSLQVVTMTKTVNAFLGKAPAEAAESDEQKMQRLYDLHAAGLPISARQAEPRPSDSFVLLTGSTGSLGSYILNSLLTRPRIARIYRLNHGPGSLDRQQKSHAAKDLRTLTEMVEFFDAETSKSYFGLSTQAYRKLLSEPRRHRPAASRDANIPAIVCRLGQVAGPTTAVGIWLKREWLPSVIASSKYLGKLLASQGRMETIDWIPVNMLGQCIVELATTIGNSTTPTSTSEQAGDSAHHLGGPAAGHHAVPRSAKRIETVPLGG
ncbi:hypothetical protein DL770_003236 [Monosporascus sp. CRB-9-2]|nr:hypothetical protein DL770_003236 [Monosporascus sp. CRB-9-2]